jgi:hypothetical protein
MIKVNKDKYSLKVEWTGDWEEHDSPPSVVCNFSITQSNGDIVNYPVMPFMRVRNYSPQSLIYDKESAIPTEEEAKQWLDMYIEEFNEKTHV